MDYKNNWVVNMRSTEIGITLRIPVPINSFGTGICKTDCFKDNNGIVYEIEAIKDACDGIVDVPIIQWDENGQQKVVGVANKLEYEDGCVIVTGRIFAGGTNEEVIFTSTKDVTSMEISSIGFGI